MALRELVDGECGRRNPLMKVASHFTEDKTFHHEQRRMRGAAARPIDFTEDEMVREFLADTSARGAMAAAGPSTFHMGTLLQEMRDIEKQNAFGPIQQGPNVAHIAMNEAGNWASEFLQQEHSDWGREFLEQPRPLPAASLGSDYLAEWENQWDELTGTSENLVLKSAEHSALAKTAADVANTMKDPKFANSEFMHKISSGEETLGLSAATTGNGTWADEFLKNSEGVLNAPPSSADRDWTSEFIASGPTDLADEWTHEFTNTDSAEVFRNVTGSAADIGASSQEDFWTQLENDWQKVAEQSPDTYGFLKQQPSNDQDQYSFEKENPFEDVTDPFNLAVQKRAEGDLPSAVLLFEAALKKDQSHAKAWELLGLTLAENEQDPGAIEAYKKCLSLDPSNLTALMGLAVSYTNESYQYQACKALEDWLRQNPKYSNLLSGAEAPIEIKNFYTTLVPREIYNRVQDLYLRAAREQPGSDLDPDIQTGLGVLLNVSSDYEKAADCFRAALHAKPNDALLWNRLGATLANGGRSEEAVQAYSRALDISPGFIRARYNLAVSCINLGAHREAAEHLISALQFQAGRSQRVMSDNMWSTLRMAINVMNKKEFLPDIEAKNLSRLAVEFGVA